jgi:hypothetical protein
VPVRPAPASALLLAGRHLPLRCWAALQAREPEGRGLRVLAARGPAGEVMALQKLQGGAAALLLLPGEQSWV